MTARLHEVLVSHLVGGAAVLAIRLSAAARQRGFDCTAWITGDGPAGQALDADGIPRRQYDLAGLRAGGRRQIVACLRMLPGLASYERPLVHVHSPVVYGLMRPALRLARARVVVHFHLDPTPEEIAWTLKVPPAHIIACARYIADTIHDAQKNRAQPVPVTAVPNAVDRHAFTPGDRDASRAALGMSTDRFVMLMIANLAPHKGQTTALRATALLAARGVPIELWLGGDDRTEEKNHAHALRALCSELHLEDRVRFLGFRTDAETLLRAADVFLLPSTREGLPLSVLEAQSAGIPVVGSTIPGLREVIADGETGLLVPADDVSGYADRVETLYGNPDLRERLTNAAAAEVVRERGWDLFENRIFDVYRQAQQR